MDLGCASEPIYARYREMASEMLARGPPSGLCCVAVSNHSMCLDVPARQLTAQNPHAAQWSAPSQARPRVHWLPTWPPPGGTGRDFQPADKTIKTKGNQAPSQAIGSLLSSLLITHHSPHSL